jgi:hypothetical protein
MDTFRRRSHRTVSEHRIEQLEALIGRILREYRTDIWVHDCDSCMVNVGIFEREAEKLGIDLREPAPF